MVNWQEATKAASVKVMNVAAQYNVTQEDWVGHGVQAYGSEQEAVGAELGASNTSDAVDIDPNSFHTQHCCPSVTWTRSKMTVTEIATVIITVHVLFFLAP